MRAPGAELLNLPEQLRALPPAPAGDGWPAVQARLERVRRRRARRATHGALAAAAALAALVLVASVRLGDRPGTPPGAQEPVAAVASDQSLAELRARSQELEAVLAALPQRPAVERAGLSLPIDSLEAQVQWLDHQLSLSGADAPATEAERLWRDRVEVMSSLLQLRYVEAQQGYL